MNYDDIDLEFSGFDFIADMEEEMKKTQEEVPEEIQPEPEEELELDYRIFDTEQIRELTEDEIINAAAATVLLAKKMHIRKVDTLSLVEQMPIKPNLDLLIEQIIFDKEDEVFNITIPVFDERESPYFKVDVLRDNRHDAFPQRLYYLIAQADDSQIPLGLRTIDVMISPLVRTTNDYRYDQSSFRDKDLVQKKQYCYFFDFETGQYVEVYADKLDEARKKGDTLNTEKTHPNVVEFLKREQLLEQIMIVTHKKSLPYFQKAKRWRLGTYNAAGGVVNKETIQRYLNEYEMFLREWARLIMKIKLIFGTVTIDEYQKTSKKIADLLTTIKRLERDNKEGKNVTKVLRDELEKYKEIRPAELHINLNKKNVLVGYFDYDLEKGVLYPNILEFDARTGKTVNKEDALSMQKYISTALEVIREEDEKQ